ncbi:MAG TPA: hypothetical protein DD725_11765 [Deltaproteobacteria bacterium]|nr:hypothetical protein [Deltaproteobacteria bacterium]
MKRKVMVLASLLVSIFCPIAIKAEIPPLPDGFVRDMSKQPPDYNSTIWAYFEAKIIESKLKQTNEGLNGRESMYRQILKALPKKYGADTNFEPTIIESELKQTDKGPNEIENMYRQILKTLPKGSGADISTIIYEKWAQDANDTKQKKSYLEKELAARQEAVRYFINHIKPKILQAHPDFDIFVEHIDSFFSASSVDGTIRSLSEFKKFIVDSTGKPGLEIKEPLLLNEPKDMENQ